MKKRIILICNICFSNNYSYYQNKNQTTKMEIQKYCNKCNKHTLHKETR